MKAPFLLDRYLIPPLKEAARSTSFWVISIVIVLTVTLSVLFSTGIIAIGLTDDGVKEVYQSKLNRDPTEDELSYYRNNPSVSETVVENIENKKVFPKVKPPPEEKKENKEASK